MFLNALILLLLMGTLYWIVFGQDTLSLPARVALVFGAIVTLGLILAFVSARQRRRRHERNQNHCAERGYAFISEPSINDVFHDSSLFRNDKARIEQLAHGKYRKAAFEVFDLSYEVTSHDSESGTTTHLIAQTVASLSEQGCANAKLCVTPMRGMAGGVFRFLGLTGSVTASPNVRADDQALAEWFNRNYNVAWNDESGRRQADSPLHLPLLQWLRDHDPLAFEIVDRQILVWRPHRLVDSAARDDLIEEGLQLASVIHQRGKSSEIPVLSIQPPAVANIKEVMLRMFISAVASWFIAGIVSIALFLVAVALGWVEQAPVPAIVAVMALTLIAWSTSGIFIYRLISRTRRPTVS